MTSKLTPVLTPVLTSQPDITTGKSAKKYCKNGEVRYNLIVKRDCKSGQIWMSFHFDGQRLRFYTGKRIKPSLWDKDKQRVKSQAEGSLLINEFIARFGRMVMEAYQREILLGNQPTVAFLLSKLKNEEISHDGKNKNSFEDEFLKFIENSKKTKGTGTIKQYRNTLNHLQAFSSQQKVVLSFESISMEFFQAFVDYLYQQGHFDNNVHKVIKNLKVFLNYAAELDLIEDKKFKKFRVPERYGNIIYLTWGEVISLYNLEISEDYLSRVRDVFCFACFTSLRYSDLQKLTTDNIDKDFLQVNVTKKREKKILRIPILPEAKAIIEKYKGKCGKRLLPCISNQKMNDYLKILGEKAGLNTPVIKVKFRGTERIEEAVPKYEVLSTHVGRKTFTTNMLAKGVSSEVIRSITDHESDRSFKRYYEIADDLKKIEILKAVSNE